MNDRDLLAVMSAILMRDRAPDALDTAIQLLKLVDEYLAKSVPMSRPRETTANA